MINTGEPVTLLDGPKLAESSLNGAELSVNGAFPHIDDQPPEPPADRDGYPMKHYYIEMVFETGDWTDGWACGRCEDAELVAGKTVLCMEVEAHTEADALTKAVTAARTAIHHAGTATHRLGPDQLKLLDGDEPGHRGEHARRKQLMRDRKPPVPWALLSDAEIERYRSAPQYREEMRARWDYEWSSGDVNGAEWWAVSVASTEVLLYPKECTFVFHGCWLSTPGSGS